MSRQGDIPARQRTSQTWPLTRVCHQGTPCGTRPQSWENSGTSYRQMDNSICRASNGIHRGDPTALDPIAEDKPSRYGFSLRGLDYTRVKFTELSTVQPFCPRAGLKVTSAYSLR